MGEYAKFNGADIKIGTCEDMYYLRFDQRFMVTAQSGNVNPVTDVEALRFRFPWPDEDGIEPGSGKFHDNGFHRSLAVPNFTAPANINHYSVQFSAQAGYLVSLPCPERLGGIIGGLTVHRNGFSGAVHLVAQKFVAGVGLVPILRCGGCGTMWREVERTRIEELVVALRAEGDRRAKDNTGGFWHAIAERVLSGIEELSAP